MTLSLVATGCGGSDGGAPDGGSIDCPTEGSYMPLATGNSWTFRVTDKSNGTVEVKTQSVGPLEDVGAAKAGVTAFRVMTTKVGGSVTSWQEDTGDRVLRHREQDMAGGTQTDEIYDPYKLRVDGTSAHTAMNASWTETYDEIVTAVGSTVPTTTSKTEMWSVEAVEEEVTVPAGTFCALRVRKISMATIAGSDKTYWFVRGIGKVKEEGVDRLEQLTEYTVP